MAAHGDTTKVNLSAKLPKGGRDAMFKNRWWIAGASAMALIFSSGTIQLFSASLFIAADELLARDGRAWRPLN
jgi:hypothetical protein